MRVNNFWLLRRKHWYVFYPQWIYLPNFTKIGREMGVL